MTCTTNDERLRFVLQPGQTLEGRFWVKLISREALAQYMDHRDMSIRAVAKKAGIGHAIVGHLLTGYRDTCSESTAKAIEAALDAPFGSLFVVKMSHVLHDNGRAA